MNVEMMKKVRDAIELNSEEFDQSTYGDKYGGVPNPHACGGACCVAGWAVFLQLEDPNNNIRKMSKVGNGSWIYWEAKDALEIEESQADALFSGSWHSGWLDQIETTSRDPLKIPEYVGGSLYVTSEDDFSPTSQEAASILDYIIQYGMEEVQK